MQRLKNVLRSEERRSINSFIDKYNRYYLSAITKRQEKLLVLEKSIEYFRQFLSILEENGPEVYYTEILDKTKTGINKIDDAIKNTADPTVTELQNKYEILTDPMKRREIDKKIQDDMEYYTDPLSRLHNILRDKKQSQGTTLFESDPTSDTKSDTKSDAGSDFDSVYAYSDFGTPATSEHGDDSKVLGKGEPGIYGGYSSDEYVIPGTGLFISWFHYGLKGLLIFLIIMCIFYMSYLIYKDHWCNKKDNNYVSYYDIYYE
jgi:hypothetical protein